MDTTELIELMKKLVDSQEEQVRLMKEQNRRLAELVAANNVPVSTQPMAGNNLPTFGNGNQDVKALIENKRNEVMARIRNKHPGVQMPDIGGGPQGM
jgi:hypothetical protein